jgi:ferredoxin
VPECPWEAIFAEDDVPKAFHDDVALNKQSLDHVELFKKSVNVDTAQPSPEQVEENKHKWGL